MGSRGAVQAQSMPYEHCTDQTAADSRPLVLGGASFHVMVVVTVAGNVYVKVPFPWELIGAVTGVEGVGDPESWIVVGAGVPDALVTEMVTVSPAWNWSVTEALL